MKTQLAHLISAALALAAAHLAAPQAAAAASVRAEASAVIRSGVSMRSAPDGQAPVIQAANADWPPPRPVLRPCRPTDPASTETCQLLLLELQ